MFDDILGPRPPRKKERPPVPAEVEGESLCPSSTSRGYEKNPIAEDQVADVWGPDDPDEDIDSLLECDGDCDDCESIHFVNGSKIKVVDMGPPSKQIFALRYKIKKCLECDGECYEDCMYNMI